MKTTLILTSPLLLNPGKQADAVGRAVQKSTVQLEADIKTNIAASVPAGRTYRKTAIVRKESRRNSALKLKRRGSNVVVGYNFHRASARGQPPAIDTGRLLNSIRALKISEMRGRVNVGVEYGQPLDDPEYLDRPFFFSRALLFEPVFYENVRLAWFGGQTP